jgi:hypothetical protein
MKYALLMVLLIVGTGSDLTAQNRVLDTKPTSTGEQLELREFTRAGTPWYGLYLVSNNSLAKEVWASAIQPHQVSGLPLTPPLPKFGEIQANWRSGGELAVFILTWSRTGVLIQVPDVTAIQPTAQLSWFAPDMFVSSLAELNRTYRFINYDEFIMADIGSPPHTVRRVGDDIFSVNGRLPPGVTLLSSSTTSNTVSGGVSINLPAAPGSPSTAARPAPVPMRSPETLSRPQWLLLAAAVFAAFALGRRVLRRK